MKKEVYEKAKTRALSYYEKASIVLTEEEKNCLEVADFGLNNLDNEGLQLITYINTKKVCSKE
ncbi:MAG: hypothetical protein ACPKM0_02450 [Pleomorphochaeta sp.]